MLNILEETLNLFTETSKNNSYVVDSLIGTTLLTYKKYQETENTIFVYASNSYEANKLYDRISKLIDKDKIVLLLSNELIRVEYISESKEIRSELIHGLYRLRNEKHLVVIATAASLLRFYPTVNTFDSNILNLKVGDVVDVEELKKKFARFGYIRVSKIDQSLEYAFRGGIIDIFPLNYDDPIRIELFDDEIESIRQFKIDTQTSFKKMDECLIIPASINILTDEELNKAKNKIFNQLNIDLTKLDLERQDLLKAQVEEDVEEILNSPITNKNYKYYGFLQDIHGSLVDYCEDFEVILSAKDDFEKASQMLYKESVNFLLELQENSKTISHLEYYNLRNALFSGAKNTYTLNPFFIDKNDISIPLRGVQEVNLKEKSAKLILELYITQKYKIVIFAKEKSDRETLKRIFDELAIEPEIIDDLNIDENKDVTVSSYDFDLSFEFSGKHVVVLSATDLFKNKRKLIAYSTKFKEGKIIESFEELEPGDYVVHEKYGIGKFSKVETMEVAGKKNDYIEILYANNDKLYIPLYQFNLIRKYVGKEGGVPRLTNLGTKQWEKTKKKIKDKINDLADRLLSLYQERANIPGFAFEKDDEIQRDFEISFHHDLTPDQAKCVEEIKHDMEQPHPMDRLLCGDVGFGKTEVALEVAMKAVLSGKQVCFLCPTTILANQHYKVAMERFRDFPVRIEVLTRMTPPSTEKLIKENLRDGKVDVLIGTHKLLANSVYFKDLGLLIIDEEQRFGVEQKEKIKERYKNIDVLTLSATPIPRTLQSSLVGLKSISTIETPPQGRFPIQTYVINYDEHVIKEIIQRELGRSGQVYYVFNDIALIYEKARKIQALVPEATIGIIHAKMNKEDIDAIMGDFYEGNIDILLATTIIENGIDVRNANLLLIENADRFGLAQLYQIKGRVGRGDRIAFAYLMIKKERKLTDDSKKRLKAIQDFTELGSGYKIAQRDLLIRGAGDILGPEQAGFIDSVGIDMYIRLLNETIKEKQTGKKIEEKQIKSKNSVSGYIPQNFAKTDDKIELYQKILMVNSIGTLNDLKARIIDQYGKLPESVTNLFIKRSIDIYLSEEEFKNYYEFPNYVKVILSDKFAEINGIGSSLFTALLKYVSKIKISYRDRLINIDIDKKEGWSETLINTLEIVHKVYMSRRKAKVIDEN